MKICSNCKKQLPDSASFCTYCGNKLGSFDEVPVNQNSNQVVQESLNQTIAGQVIPQQPNTQKKLSKGAIIAIVLAVILALAVIGGIAEKVIQQQKAEKAISDIEIPDFDIESPDLIEFPDYETEENNSSEDDNNYFGDVKNNKYTNNFANLKFKRPSSDWSFMSKEEIYQHYLDAGSNVLYDETSKETYMEENSQRAYYDMFMYNKTNNTNIQTTIAVPTVTEFSINDFYEGMVEGLETMFDDVVFSDAGIVSIGDNLYSVKEGKMSYSGKGLKQYYAFSKVKGTIVTICITVDGDDDTSFLTYFDDIVVE